MKRIRAEEQGDGEDLRYSGVFAREPVREEREGVDASMPLSTRPAPEGPCRSFDDIYSRCKRDAWAYIRRSGVQQSEVMDVFQTSFLKMHKWVIENDVPPEPGPILFHFIRCEIVDHLRGQRRRARRNGGEVDADTLASGEPGADELLSIEDLYLTADAICSALPPDAGLVFGLSEIDELSVEDIAKVLGRREATVRVQIHRARAAFAEMAASFSWEE